MDSKLSVFKGWPDKVAAAVKPVLLVLLVCMFGSKPATLSAQAIYGTVVGTVTDSSGAAVAGATVTITNIGTNEKHSMKSGNGGDYRFVSLLPANYRLEVEAASFKHFVQQSVMVQVNDTARVDAVLQVGATTETVEVTTSQPLLQTDSGALGAQVEGKIVQEMPLNGRNVQNLISLVPGVVPQGGTSGSIQNNQTRSLNAAWGNYQIGGGIAGYGAQFVDGGPVNIYGQNYLAFSPVQDVVQEFKVDLNAVSAEFGRFGGGVVSLTTKGGTNAFHGSVYEYFRNTVLNANPFFNKAVNKPRAPWNQNQYGVTFGGPIVKDKVFFFFAWERYDQVTHAAVNTNVPTVNMRNGIISRPIQDPNTNLNPANGPVHCNILANTPQVGQYTIPASCFDPTSKVMLDYFPPQPNATGSFNWVIPGTGGNVSDQYTGRIDYNLSEKQRIFGRYSYWPMQDRTYERFPGATGGFLPNGIGSHYLTQQAVIGDTYTLNPTTIFDVRVSYLRQRGINGGANVGHTDMSKFGPAYANYNLSFSALPEAIYNGPNNLFNMTPISGWENNLYENYAIGASVVKIINVHSLKFGGEARRMSKNGIGNFPNAAGRAQYNTAMTAIPGVSGSGDEFAAFLLGEFTSINLQTVIPTTTYNYSYALYGTDTWQVNRKLTLNLGLRWELPGAPGEKKDRTSVILPNQIDPTTGFNGAVVLVNSPLWKPRGMEPNRYVFVDPRVGFAYRLPASGVIRGGYGLVFTSNDMPSGIGAYNSPVAAAITTQVNASVPTYFERNPFPNNVLQPAGRTRSDFSKDLLGQVAQGPVPTPAYTYFQQWNLSLSKQWKGDWLTEIAYLGSKGTHLAMQGFYNTGYDTVGLDQIPSAYYDHTTGIALTGPDTGKLLTANSTAPNAACKAWGTALSTAAKTQAPTVGQCLRPYPQFQDYQNGADYSGSSTYHAMAVSGTKRFGSGGRLNANWTWAKMITDADVVNGIQMESTSGGLGGGAVGYLQDFTNKKAERALGSFSTRQRVVVSYVLDMPFGTGRKWLNSGGTLNYFVGGWSINGITTFQSGFPIELNASPNTFVTSFGGGTLRPNYTAGCNKKNSLSHYDKYANKAWFNAACFTLPGSYAFGNEPRVDSVLQADGVNNFDFAVLKATKIKEVADVQFRMEFFNILNRTQFLPPGNSMGGSNYNAITNTRNQPRVAQASLRVNF